MASDSTRSSAGDGAADSGRAPPSPRTHQAGAAPSALGSPTHGSHPVPTTDLDVLQQEREAIQDRFDMLNNTAGQAAIHPVPTAPPGPSVQPPGRTAMLLLHHARLSHVMCVFLCVCDCRCRSVDRHCVHTVAPLSTHPLWHGACGGSLHASYPAGY